MRRHYGTSMSRSGTPNSSGRVLSDRVLSDSVCSAFQKKSPVARVLELRHKVYSNSSSREMPAQHGLGRTRSWAGPRMLLEVSVFPSRLGTYACAAWPRPSLQLCIVPWRLYYVSRAQLENTNLHITLSMLHCLWRSSVAMSRVMCAAGEFKFTYSSIWTLTCLAL